ncbi:putative Ig domain-containing protein [Arthrobacter sp. Hz1]
MLRNRQRSIIAAAIVGVMLPGTLTVAPAVAAVSVTRAEVSGSALRIEGTAIASRDISVDNVVMGRSDSSGKFRIERDPYTAPADCTVYLRDGSATVTTRTLTGCTVTQPPVSDTTAPSVPANLTATLSGSTATLSWTASTDNVGVTGYRVSRNGTVLAGTVTTTTFSDPGLAAGTYTYTVAAIDTAGNISGASNSASVTVPPASASDTTAPSIPTNLITTVVGTTVDLSWGISTDDTGVTGYRVHRNGSLLGTTDATSFSDTGLAAGTYTYTVAAFDAAGNTSTASNSASATVSPAEPLTFITPAQMPDATVGQAYLGYIVCSDPPGPSTFRFRLVSGSLPDGTRFVKNTLENRPEARVTGTPTRAATFTFTVEGQDNTGATARRTFTIKVLPA